jgi:hypothetical protein
MSQYKQTSSQIKGKFAQVSDSWLTIHGQNGEKLFVRLGSCFGICDLLDGFREHDLASFVDDGNGETIFKLTPAACDQILDSSRESFTVLCGTAAYSLQIREHA